jgi:hypothetical protein
MTCHLAAGGTRRIDSADGFNVLTVVSGCIWVTTTPADQDIVLRSGDTWRSDSRWPVVIQAIDPATIALAREETSASAAVRPAHHAEVVDAVIRRARAWRRRLSTGAPR